MWVLERDSTFPKRVAGTPFRLRSSNPRVRKARLVVVCELAQRCRVANHQSRAFRLQDLTPLQLRKQPGNRLSRSSDHLRDFLVGKSKLQPKLRLAVFSVLEAPLQKQLSQLLGGGV